MVSKLRLEGGAEEVVTWRIHIEVVELGQFLDRPGCLHVLNLLRMRACRSLGRRAGLNAELLLLHCLELKGNISTGMSILLVMRQMLGEAR